MIKRRRLIAVRYLVKFSLLALVLLSIYGVGLAWPISRAGGWQEFEVTKGQTAGQIAIDLKEAKLIRSPQMFRLVVKIEGLAGKLQAGMYQLSPSLSTREVVRALTRRTDKQQKLTIPEGYRSEQIAEVAGLPSKEFLTAASGLEGQLFPDTYFVAEGSTPGELVEILHGNFVRKVGQIDQETLILASLVERETKGEEEKSVVAGILKKRLAAGWALELDATVQYFLGKPGNWWPNTTLLDRKLASPYNTYLHPGLPPAPIGNPGLASIRAVQNPRESLYWFYLHDKTGIIHYAETLAQHNQNIAAYIR